LILKFVKNVKVNVVMRQHNIWCVCACVRAFCVKMCAGPAHIFKKKVLMSSLKMI